MTSTAIIFDKSPARRRELARLVTATGIFGHLELCASNRETLNRLDGSPVDIIFYGTKRISKKGMSWLRRLTCKESWMDIPVLAFAGTEKEDDRILGIESGASDCFSFETPKRELLARIQRFLASKKRLEELRETNQRLAQLTITDPLTGVGNRRHFDETLVSELKRNNRSRNPFSLLMVDIDHFKKVNDTVGHQGGDELLRNVARVLHASVRNYDTVCRFGGEEFAIIMPGTSATHAYTIAERIRCEVATINRNRTLGDFPLTVSIGMRCIRGPECIEATRIVADADQAMYRAKSNGRNRTEIYTPNEEFTFTPARSPRFAPLAPAMSMSM
jgi:two-component system cell cycle response regulator